ncbi:helix-turn-helix domain-containing protein [Pontiella sp.]|uniref:helix-turn-helix domain-containing protein n=1 Tax=Pontiella sp. TaxID=2837462 RepID=UPI003569D1F9
MSNPDGRPDSAQLPNLEEAVGNFERNLILEALEKCNGIQTRAADYLGTTRRILRYRMDKLGIKPRRGISPQRGKLP